MCGQFTAFSNGTHEPPYTMFVESVFETSLSFTFLKDRFNEHRRLVDKTNTKSKPTTVSEHFLSQPNHCHTDMQLIPLELIHSSRDSIRKAALE